MADLVITPANVIPDTLAKLRRITFGATVVAGQALYHDVSDSTYKLASAAAAAAAGAKVVGLAAEGGADGQPGWVIYNGLLEVGNILTIGEVYVLSVDGAIAPCGDLASSDYVTVLGIAVSATTLDVQIHNSNIEHA